ncbi:hypothetical protein H2198_000989 [Neophaeococcomyces mojaviensis]|uniref:Uncharacterized protein n=1 Tax=Neophaeococcomyces mojaviensis TaxID=3383035 RepID=A0ACC3AIE7_9EURO|nr:hypothetical protein H2198_000989 [Knufia sp. JES_112]
MTRFQLHDTVALKADGSFIGNVERISGFDQEPLEDMLIIAHTYVPPKLLGEFVLTGTPPSGYVFVGFALQEQGSALIAEDELFLVDRSLDLGETVKRNGSQLAGTVINVSNTYILDPIWQPQLTGDFRAKPADECSGPDHQCTAACSPLDPRIAHPWPCRLIHNVPFEELKRPADFVSGDYVIQQDWQGVVDAFELVVVIKLDDNSVVAVLEVEQLFIPIPDYDKPLVHLPDFDGISRPHHVSAMQGWGQAVPAEDLECGQFVITNHRVIKNGRWLHGSYDPKVKPQGRVLMVRSRRLDIRWLMCNAYTPEPHWDAKRPDNNNPYENLSTFPAPQEIRRDKRLSLYDPSKPTTTVENRTRSAIRSQEGTTSKNTSPVNLSSTFSVGDRVKFRDPAGAAVKYQGEEIDDVIHHHFERINHKDTFGYDLNELKIVLSKQRATIRWQDGSVSEHESTVLNKVALFEADLSPADIVVAREGMKQRLEYDPVKGEAQPDRPLKDFNEMKFFEQPHDLHPAKVGIIQNVNPSERVAQVRWFQNANIRITTYGNALGAESRFGPISDHIEDVSLYEVMTFPGITRKIRDIVTIPPSMPSSFAVKLLWQLAEDDLKEVHASIASLSQLESRHAQDLLEWMQHNARMSMDEPPRQQVQGSQYKSHHSIDWVGEIVKLGLDGLVTIRVNTEDQGRDVVVEHDQVLSFIDDQVWPVDLNEDPMEMDDISGSEGSELSMTSEDEVLSETVEYEGGERMDNDSGDENWESDSNGDEDDKRQDQSSPTSIVMTDVPTPTTTSKQATLGAANNAVQSILPSSANANNPMEPLQQLLSSFLPSTAPPSFLSLDRDPPPDQFRATQPSQTSSTFLKRIAKEHRILSNSLPDHEVYVRTYDSRLDLLRCLIIGPRDTPYEYAPFLIDLHLGPTFPREPPTAHFHSWTSGMGRINPNLYEEGKICLSLLGTWPGKSETEGWSEKATILQLLVSLQGLVFVKAPFFNEAGFEGYEETGQYKREALQYTEKAFVMARNFVKHALTSPIAGLEDVLAWLYLSHHKHANGASTADTLIQITKQSTELCMLNQVIERSESLMRASEDVRKQLEERKAMHQRTNYQLLEDDNKDEKLLAGDGSSGKPTTVFLMPLSKGAFVMLRKTIQGLQQFQQKELVSMSAANRVTDARMGSLEGVGTNRASGSTGMVEDTHRPTMEDVD